jgi:tRNA pseudouridine32 synthase / 23S rRNA pseudouridine746 synthase
MVAGDPQNGGLRVVAFTPRWVVVDKPVGMLSVPGKGEAKADCVAARVRAMFPSATGPLVVHRLDMETSGLLVLGLDEEAQRELSGQFERRETRKAYVALVETFGREVRDDVGAIDLPLRADLDRRPIQIVDFTRGRPAQTRYRVLAREIDRVRLRLEPITGRTHQLRVHCADPRGLGTPIVGDSLYGAGLNGHKGMDDLAQEGHDNRLMLHAAELAFRAPGGGWIECVSPVPF